MSCKAAESVEDAVHDNRMFAECAFYCIANSAGNWLLTREKQSIHLCRRDKTKKQRCCAEYRQEHLPQEHALEQSGNAGERQDEKTKNSRTARDRIWNRKVQPVFPSPFKIESSVVFRYRNGQRKQNIRISWPASALPNSAEPIKFPHREKAAVQPTPMERQKRVHWKMAL